MIHNRKTKILYGLPSFSIGGIENQLAQQLNYFDSTKYEFHIVTLFLYKNRPDFYEKLPPAVIVHGLDFKGYFDFKNYRALFHIISKVQPAIVITSMFSASAVFRVMKLFFHYKLITREHNTYTDRRILHRLWEKATFHLSDAIVTVSRDVAEFYRKQNWIPRNRVQTINNGIDLSPVNKFISGQTIESQSKTRSSLKISDSEHIIINVARLKEQKNHAMLIEVFNDFKKQRGDYRLLILGDGQEKENLLEQISRHHLEEDVQLLGFRKDVYYFYSISDFFVLSSKIEGFPNVFLEAMAFGLPIISTKVPGANEMIIEGRNGFIVSSPKEMLEKMLLLSSLSSEARDQMRKYCLDTVKKFDIRIIIRAYEELFNQLLK